MGNVETPTGPLVWVVLRTLFHQFAHIYRAWRQKELFANSDVAMYTNAVDRSREAWGDLGWKVSTWIHWTCAHSPYFAQEYSNIYIFSSIPSAKRNSPFKRDLHNSCKGWAVVKPRLSRLSMGHVVNTNNLVKVLPWVVDGAGGLGAGKTSGAGTRGVDLNAAVGGRTGYTNTNGGESSNNGSKIHADCYPAENPSL